MIQSADIGVGITGKEGLQAARSADYAIALGFVKVVTCQWSVQLCQNNLFYAKETTNYFLDLQCMRAGLYQCLIHCLHRCLLFVLVCLTRI